MMDNVLLFVNKTVNFIKAKGLNRPQYQEFLKIMDADNGDIMFF